MRDCFLGSNPTASAPLEFASIDDTAVAAALSEVPSGKTIPGTERTIEPVLSFQRDDGTFCREYMLKDRDGVVSIACFEQGNMAATRPQERYVPAGSAETIDARLTSIHAGWPLDGPAEEAALESVRR